MHKRSLFTLLSFLLIGALVGAVAVVLIRPSRTTDERQGVASEQVLAPSVSAQTGDPSSRRASDETIEAAADPPGTPVRVETVSPRHLSLHLDLQGTLAPKVDVRVAPKTSGRVESVLVDVGDDVQSGDTLLVLEDDELLIAKEQSAAAIKMAQSNLARIRSGARPQEIDLAQAQVDQASANLQQATTHLDRMRALYESGSVPKSQLEQGQTQYDVALSSLRAAESQLELAKLGAKREEIEAAEAQLAQAEASLKLAELQLEHTVVTAPLSGIVASRSIDPGSFAAAGTPVMQIVQTDPIVLRVEVGARDVVHLEKNLPAYVSTGAYPGRSFPGEVTLIERVADPGSRLFGVRIEIPNPDGLLQAGMSSRVQVIIDEARDALAVPEHAILPSIEGDDQAAVFVISDDDIAVRRRVSLGLAADGWVQITDGIDTGERVVVSGHNFLADGDRVRIIEESTAGRASR